MKVVDEGGLHYRYSHTPGDANERGRVRANALEREAAENEAAFARLENLLGEWEPQGARVVSLYLCKTALKWTDARCARAFNITVNTVKRWIQRVEHSAKTKPAFRFSLNHLTYQMLLFRRSP